MAKYQPREWGPDENGRWSNTAMQQRDELAAIVAEIFDRCLEFDQSIRTGETTKTFLLLSVNQISELAVFAAWLLKDAGADVRPEEMRNKAKRKRL